MSDKLSPKIPLDVETQLKFTKDWKGSRAEFEKMLRKANKEGSDDTNLDVIMSGLSVMFNKNKMDKEAMLLDVYDFYHPAEAKTVKLDKDTAKVLKKEYHELFGVKSPVEMIFNGLKHLAILALFLFGGFVLALAFASLRVFSNPEWADDFTTIWGVATSTKPDDFFGYLGWFTTATVLGSLLSWVCMLLLTAKKPVGETRMWTTYFILAATWGLWILTASFNAFASNGLIISAVLILVISVTFWAVKYPEDAKTFLFWVVIGITAIGFILAHIFSGADIANSVVLVGLLAVKIIERVNKS